MGEEPIPIKFYSNENSITRNFKYFLLQLNLYYINIQEVHLKKIDILLFFICFIHTHETQLKFKITHYLLS